MKSGQGSTISGGAVTLGTEAEFCDVRVKEASDGPGRGVATGVGEEALEVDEGDW